MFVSDSHDAQVIGSLHVSHDIITFASTTFPNWHLAVDEVLLVGEYTNQDGPFYQDYFLVLVDSREKWYWAPMAAKGIEDALTFLGGHLGADLPTSLVGSTDLASRIMWPPVLAGKPLFEFERRQVEGSFWDRVLRFWRPRCAVHREPTHEVLAFLATLRKTDGVGEKDEEYR